MAEIVVRFWAGAQRAAGHERETLHADTVGEVRHQLAARAALTNVCAVATMLVDGRAADDATALEAGTEVDVLPPFAGGADPAARPPLVVGIGGSTRVGSTTTRLLELCLAEVAQRGARTHTVGADALARLPIYTGASPSGAAQPLLDAVRAADCVVIASPGYHGGMSGLVKNAIDHLEALRADARPYLDGRAVGLLVTASGWQACGTALESLRSAVHALRGWPTPLGVTMNSVEQGLEDERVLGAVGVVAEQVVAFAHWQAAARVVSG